MKSTKSLRLEGVSKSSREFQVSQFTIPNIFTNAFFSQTRSSGYAIAMLVRFCLMEQTVSRTCSKSHHSSDRTRSLKLSASSPKAPASTSTCAGSFFHWDHLTTTEFFHACQLTLHIVFSSFTLSFQFLFWCIYSALTSNKNLWHVFCWFYCFSRGYNNKNEDRRKSKFKLNSGNPKKFKSKVKSKIQILKFIGPRVVCFRWGMYTYERTIQLLRVLCFWFYF